MPGSMPATSQLEWLSSTTAMIVLFWSRATRDLLRSFGWGITALHRLDAATKLPCPAARPIASIGLPVTCELCWRGLSLLNCKPFMPGMFDARENRQERAEFPREPIQRLFARG